MIYARPTDFDDLIFRVDRWLDRGNRIDCCLSASSNLLIGRGAFDAAVRLYPDNYITLRNRSWVIARHEGVAQALPLRPRSEPDHDTDERQTDNDEPVPYRD
jgi:hypothetical protein